MRRAICKFGEHFNNYGFEKNFSCSSSSIQTIAASIMRHEQEISFKMVEENFLFRLPFSRLLQSFYEQEISLKMGAEKLLWFDLPSSTLLQLLLSAINIQHSGYHHKYYVFFVTPKFNNGGYEMR